MSEDFPSFQKGKTPCACVAHLEITQVCQGCCSACAQAILPVKEWDKETMEEFKVPLLETYTIPTVARKYLQTNSTEFI